MRTRPARLIYVVFSNRYNMVCNGGARRHTYETNSRRVSTRQILNGKRMTESTGKRKCKLCNDTNNGNGYTGDSRVACPQLSLRSW